MGLCTEIEVFNQRWSGEMVSRETKAVQAQNEVPKSKVPPASNEVVAKHCRDGRLL